MKMRTYKKLTALFAVVLSFAITSASALTDAQVASIKKAFTGVPTPELAAKAAKVVAQTPDADREAMAVAVTKHVVGKKPAVVVAVVSAICAVAPETAPAVAAAAAELVKKNAEAVAVAAIKAAPAQSEKIAQAITEAAPSSSTKVAARVLSMSKSAQVTPTSGSIIIQPGPIRGIEFMPTTPPTPAVNPVEGYDPNRYSAPGS